MIVAATSEDEVAGVRARLDALGVGAVDVVAPTAARRLVLATVAHEWEAERVVAALRAEGRIAVTRPDGGPRLEAWERHTRPIPHGRAVGAIRGW